jgi:hypothetical protein
MSNTLGDGKPALSKWGAAKVGDIEITDIQKSILAPTPTPSQMRVGELLREAHHSLSHLKIPERRLDTLGQLSSHCTVSNDPDRIKALEEHLQLAMCESQIAKNKKDLKQQKLLLKEQDHMKHANKSRWDPTCRPTNPAPDAVHI